MTKYRCDCGSYFRDDAITMYALGATRAESVAEKFPQVLADGIEPAEAFYGALNLAFDQLHECDACKRIHLVRHGRHIATWKREWTADDTRID